MLIYILQPTACTTTVLYNLDLWPLELKIGTLGTAVLEIVNICLGFWVLFVFHLGARNGTDEQYAQVCKICLAAYWVNHLVKNQQ